MNMRLHLRRRGDHRGGLGILNVCARGPCLLVVRDDRHVRLWMTAHELVMYDEVLDEVTNRIVTSPSTI